MPHGALGSFAFTLSRYPVQRPTPNTMADLLRSNLHGLGEEWMQSPSGFSWNAIPEYARMWQSTEPEEAFVTASALGSPQRAESLEQVINGELEQSEFVAGWLEGLRAFDALRQLYLLYPVQR